MNKKLSDYCINITDGEHGSVVNAPNGEYYLLSNKNIINGEVIITSADRKISEGSYKKINKRTKLEKSDVLISTVGTLGKLAIVNKKPNYEFQRSVGIIKCNKNKLLPEYLYYYLSLNSLQNRLINNSKGAVQKCIFINDLKELLVDIPNINLQKIKINLLSYIDKKIKLNNKINEELEKLAKTLYDYWFIQFDFPDENERPYKSSGGKMIYNKELKREIPVGWSNCTLNDICEMYQPLTLQEDNLIDNGKYFVYGANGIIGKYSEYNHLKSEIAIACRGNSCGVLNRTLPYSWITGNAMVIKLKDAEIHNEYLYHALKYTNISGVITGSGQPQITRLNLALVKILKPNRDIVLKYCSFIKDNVELRLKNELENKSLINLRDFLLPMLMNGQVTIL